MFPHHPTHPSSQPGGHTSLHAALLILGVLYIFYVYTCAETLSTMRIQASGRCTCRRKNTSRSRSTTISFGPTWTLLSEIGQHVVLQPCGSPGGLTQPPPFPPSFTTRPSSPGGLTQPPPPPPPQPPQLRAGPSFTRRAHHTPTHDHRASWLSKHVLLLQVCHETKNNQ